MTNVAMIGVGKLGQACAEVMAETYPVVGYDVSPRSPKNFEMVDTVEIHTHKQDEAGVMRMRPMEKLIIPARSEIVLKPGADHFMLYGVHSEWIAGATGHFKLMTETGTTLSTDVMIVKATDFNPYK